MDQDRIEPAIGYTRDAFLMFLLVTSAADEDVTQTANNERRVPRGDAYVRSTRLSTAPTPS